MKSLFVIMLFVSIVLPHATSAQTGDIQGIVYQRGTDTGLAGADVHLLDTDQRETTDANGRFQFTELPEGSYILVVTHPTETTPTRVQVDISSDATTEAEIRVGAAFKLGTVIVEGKRLSRTVSRVEIRGRELLRIPGTHNDTLKGLMTLPSIGIPNDYFGALYIRGSEPGSNLYYLDRTPIGYPFHWGGLLSTISSETIETIDIYAGGYGAEFGLDSQSVLDISTRESIERSWQAKFNLNILYSEGVVETKIGERGYASASGRRSYFDLILGPFLERETGTTQQLPYLSDYQLKSTYLLTEKHHLTVNAFAAADRFKIVEDLESAETVEGPGSFVEFENGFNGQGIHLRSNFTEKLSSHLSLTRSENFLNIGLNAVIAELSSIGPDGESELLRNTLRYDINVNAPVYAVREDVSYALTPAFQLESGFLYTFSPAKSLEKGSFEENFASDDIDDVFEGEGFEEVDEEFGYDFYRTEGYVQGRYDPLSFLSVALGVRLDYLNAIEQVSVQPRGSVSFQLASGSNLRFAYGHYQQSPQPSHLLAENGNPDLKSSLTQHFILELEHDLSSRTEIKFATYYKDAQKLVTADAESYYLNQGAAFVSGVEAFLRHRIPDKFFGWISYAYTHAERRETPADAYQPHLFDNTHIVSVVANYSFIPKFEIDAPRFEIGAKWQYLSGTSEAPISSIVLIQDPATRGLNPLLAGADDQLKTELLPYHKLDLRISYKWNIFGLNIGSFVDILNVYNRKNQIKFILEEAILDVQGQEIGIEREVFDAPQLPRIIYGGLTLEL